ncbi:unnamed protein product [Soboliphyme baturini]|uniref:Uncharacterized protein n=1 Tax=Soboliphyme baturini TaxID=241478 RepID=A0A3P8CIY6_9BILA|nr:unnamed protein product [Soboliphyme baturini]
MFFTGYGGGRGRGGGGGFLPKRPEPPRGDISSVEVYAPLEIIKSAEIWEDMNTMSVVSIIYLYSDLDISAVTFLYFKF